MDPAMAGLTLPSMYTLDSSGEEIPVDDQHAGDGECSLSLYAFGEDVIEEARCMDRALLSPAHARASALHVAG